MADPISMNKPAAVAASSEVPAVQVERDKRGKTVYRITQEFVIEGRIQKPSVFIALDRQSMEYKWAQLTGSVRDRILQSVEKKPF